MSYNNEPTIESIRENVLKVIAVNKVNQGDKVSTEISRLLDIIEIDLRKYAIASNRDKNVAESKVFEVEKKVKQQFAEMTETIMELIKIK
jgi:hypothetical protein